MSKNIFYLFKIGTMLACEKMNPLEKLQLEWNFN